MTFEHFIMRCLITASVSTVVFLTLTAMEPPAPRIGMLDFQGLIEEYQAENRNIPDSEVESKAQEFGIELSNIVAGLNEKGWILFPTDVPVGATDLTPDVRRYLCRRLAYFCDKVGT